MWRRGAGQVVDPDAAGTRVTRGRVAENPAHVWGTARPGPAVTWPFGLRAGGQAAGARRTFAVISAGRCCGWAPSVRCQRSIVGARGRQTVGLVPRAPLPRRGFVAGRPSSPTGRHDGHRREPCSCYMPGAGALSTVSHDGPAPGGPAAGRRLVARHLALGGLPRRLRVCGGLGRWVRGGVGGRWPGGVGGRWPGGEGGGWPGG